MKGFSGFGNSPVKKAKLYDFSKAKDYSHEATKGTFGDKLAKAVTPKNLADTLPVGKAIKAGKAVYNYFTG